MGPNLITSLLGGAGPIIGGAIQRNTGVNFINLGASLAQLGAAQSAQAYRLASAASIAAGQYNAGIERLNLNRQLDATAREIQQVSSTQRTQAASTGFSSGSKSFLSVMNDTLTGFERFIIDSKNTSVQRQQAILFEAQTQAVAFENQARASEYQGQVQSALAQSRSSGFSGLGQIFGQIGSLFG